MIKRLLFILIFFTNTNFASTINAKIIKVYDGDTVTFTVESNDTELNKSRGIEPTKFRARFYGIDAPELNQEFGKQARDYLSNLILNKVVQLESVNIDNYENNVDIYGRYIVKVYYNSEYINLKLVEKGFAWSYVKYNHNDPVLNEAERQAKSNSLGLWNTNVPPIKPEDWRKLQKSGINPTELGPSCDYKLSCKSIKTCEEAIYLLNECGFIHLDSDSDGVPCENLCLKQ